MSISELTVTLHLTAFNHFFALKSLWGTQEIPPEKKCEKNCLFSRKFCDLPVQVGARSGLMTIFKLKMRARRAFSA